MMTSLSSDSGQLDLSLASVTFAGADRPAGHRAPMGSRTRTSPPRQQRGRLGPRDPSSALADPECETQPVLLMTALADSPLALTHHPKETS
jgi:hypothetical protein